MWCLRVRVSNGNVCAFAYENVCSKLESHLPRETRGVLFCNLLVYHRWLRSLLVRRLGRGKLNDYMYNFSEGALGRLDLMTR